MAMIWEIMRDAKALQGEERWEEAAAAWRAIANALAKGGPVAPAYEEHAVWCESKIKLVKNLTNPNTRAIHGSVSSSGNVTQTKENENGVERMKSTSVSDEETMVVEETPTNPTVLNAPRMRGSVVSIEDRLMGTAQFTEEVHPTLQCKVEEVNGEYHLILPKCIPATALVQRMRKDTPTGVVYLPVEWPAVGMEFQTSEGRSVRLVSKPIEFQVPFRI